MQENLVDRLLTVFRDENDMRGSDYYETIDRFLRNSQRLILICSPHAAKSEFVRDEVRRFIQARGKQNIIPVLISGLAKNEAAPGQEDEVAFPSELTEVDALPLAVDYRGFSTQKDRVSKGVYYGQWYTLLADIYDISRSEIEQRDKKRQTRARSQSG
jgi:hypothetical protein